MKQPFTAVHTVFVRLCERTTTTKFIANNNTNITSQQNVRPVGRSFVRSSLARCTHSPTHSLTHTLTHSLTHSLTCCALALPSLLLPRARVRAGTEMGGGLLTWNHVFVLAEPPQTCGATHSHLPSTILAMNGLAGSRLLLPMIGQLAMQPWWVYVAGSRKSQQSVTPHA